jgi:hypothetical protein
VGVRAPGACGRGRRPGGAGEEGGRLVRARCSNMRGAQATTDSTS